MNCKRQVFFNSDANGETLLSVAVYSLLKTSLPDRHLDIYIAHNAAFAEAGAKERIGAIVAKFPFASVMFLDFTPCIEKYGKLFSMMLWGFPLCDKVLPADVTGTMVYIDIDMLVRKDLEGVYSLDLKGQGMVAAAVNESRREYRTYLSENGWPEDAGYSFNNGFMVVDLDVYRAEHLSDKVIEWFLAHWEIAKDLEQDSQNVVFGNRTLRLKPTWNYTDGWLERILKHNPFGKEWRVFPPNDMLEAIIDPTIIHYIGRRKPTRATHRPERRIFRKMMCELGLLKKNGKLPGESFATRLTGLLFDCYHAPLRLYARALLAMRRLFGI